MTSDGFTSTVEIWHGSSVATSGSPIKPSHQLFELICTKKETFRQHGKHITMIQPLNKSMSSKMLFFILLVRDQPLGTNCSLVQGICICLFHQTTTNTPSVSPPLECRKTHGWEWKSFTSCCPRPVGKVSSSHRSVQQKEVQIEVSNTEDTLYYISTL